MGHKKFSLVLIALLTISLIALAGCGGTETTTSGTGGGSSSQSSPPSTVVDTPSVELTIEELTTGYSSYIGKTAVLTAVMVDSVADSYLMVGKIRCEVQKPEDLKNAQVCDQVEVKGQVFGIESGDVIILKNCQIQIIGSGE